MNNQNPSGTQSPKNFTFGELRTILDKNIPTIEQAVSKYDEYKKTFSEEKTRVYEFKNTAGTSTIQITALDKGPITIPA